MGGEVLTITHYIGGKLVGQSIDFPPSLNYPEFSTFINSQTFIEYILVAGVWKSIGGQLVPDYQTDFSTDDGITQGTLYTVGGGNVGGPVNRQNVTVESYTLDLETLMGFPVDSDLWTCDFPITFPTVGLSSGFQALMSIVLTDLASGSSNSDKSNQDSMGLFFLDGTGDSAFKVNASDNNAVGLNTVASPTNIGVSTFYIRLIRNFDDIIMEIYSDAERTSLTSSTTATQANVTGLRFWKIYNYFSTVGTWNGTSTFNVSELQFFNAVNL